VASDVGLGDSETPYLDVVPADSSTVATLELRTRVGVTPIPVTGGPLVAIADSADFSQRWTAEAPVVYGEAGRSVLHWEVAGTGEREEDVEVYVVAAPVAGGPTWTPGRSRVANYVPHRTLALSTSSIIDSQDVYELTFDSTTRPTGIMVDRLIADGVDWITALITPLNTRSQAACALLAALWAAIAVERSWPNDDQSLQRANDMEKRLDLLLAGLKASNSDANDQDAGTGAFGVDIVPVWQFPAADPRWDYAGYW
jgi:hypothetical protein